MHIKDIGQLFITGIEGLSLTPTEKSLIEKENIGGVILFKHNYEHPAQLAELINEIQTLRDEYPLFISVDQEGGRVKRFQTHFTQFPSMLEVGEKKSPKLTFEVHKIMAEELRACGVNLNFSPCADIWSNPKNKVIGDRAFGTDLENVTGQISAAIRGLHTGKILGCAKHFPGHGNTLKDSHYDLPFVKKELKELEEFEIQPFIKAAKAKVEFIMMAHLVVDSIDNEVPCTISKKAYDYCRKILKFNKIIITDDMEMKAITGNYGVGESASLALNAGADILLYRNFNTTIEAIESIRDKVRTQDIKLSVIEKKVERIYNCKKAFLSDYKPVVIPHLSKMFSERDSDKILQNLNLVSKPDNI